MTSFPTADVLADNNWAESYSFVMLHEDSRRECAIVPDPTEDDPNAQAISGCNSAVWPEDFAEIAALPQDQRAGALEAFYARRFWNQWFPQLSSVQLCKRVLDSAVNQGSGTAVKILQEAVNEVKGANILAVDGVWGSATLSIVQEIPGAILIPAFQQARVDCYRRNTKASPETMAQWVARAEE